MSSATIQANSLLPRKQWWQFIRNIGYNYWTLLIHLHQRDGVKSSKKAFSYQITKSYKEKKSSHPGDVSLFSLLYQNTQLPSSTAISAKLHMAWRLIWPFRLLTSQPPHAALLKHFSNCVFVSLRNTNNVIFLLPRFSTLSSFLSLLQKFHSTDGTRRIALWQLRGWI